MSAVVKPKLLLYADDSAILVFDKKMSTVEKTFIDDLQLICDWLIYARQRQYCLVQSRRFGDDIV